MGTVFEIHCTHCGFTAVTQEKLLANGGAEPELEEEEITEENQLYLGVGIETFVSLCEKYPDKKPEELACYAVEPYYCKACGIVFAGLGPEADISCPVCNTSLAVHSYYSPEASSSEHVPGALIEVQERDCEEVQECNLLEGNYYCPRCKTYSLQFTFTGRWD